MSIIQYSVNELNMKIEKAANEIKRDVFDLNLMKQWLTRLRQQMLYGILCFSKAGALLNVI